MLIGIKNGKEFPIARKDMGEWPVKRRLGTIQAYCAEYSWEGKQILAVVEKPIVDNGGDEARKAEEMKQLGEYFDEVVERNA